MFFCPGISFMPIDKSSDNRSRPNSSTTLLYGKGHGDAHCVTPSIGAIRTTESPILLSALAASFHDQATHLAQTTSLTAS